MRKSHQKVIKTLPSLAKQRRTLMRGNGKRIAGTLIVRGALHQMSEEDDVAGEWVTKTYSATFAIEDREFASMPRLGEKVNIGPEEAARLLGRRVRGRAETEWKNPNHRRTRC